MDDELHIDAFGIHVLKPDTGIVIAAALGRESDPHEGLEMALGALTRGRFAQHPGRRGAPALLAAKAVPMTVGGLTFLAGIAGMNLDAMVLEIVDYIRWMQRQVGIE